MASSKETVICTYRVISGKEKAFEKLLNRHWPALHELGLVTDDHTTVFKGVDDQGRPYYVEIFDWLNEEAVNRAHSHPEIAAIWEPMDTLCEARDGRPNMEFPHVERMVI